LAKSPVCISTPLSLREFPPPDQAARDVKILQFDPGPVRLSRARCRLSAPFGMLIGRRVSGQSSRERRKNGSATPGEGGPTGLHPKPHMVYLLPAIVSVVATGCGGQ